MPRSYDPALTAALVQQNPQAVSAALASGASLAGTDRRHPVLAWLAVLATGPSQPSKEAAVLQLMLDHGLASDWRCSLTHASWNRLPTADRQAFQIGVPNAWLRSPAPSDDVGASLVERLLMLDRPGLAEQVMRAGPWWSDRRAVHSRVDVWGVLAGRASPALWATALATTPNVGFDDPQGVFRALARHTLPAASAVMAAVLTRCPDETDPAWRRFVIEQVNAPYPVDLSPLWFEHCPWLWEALWQEDASSGPMPAVLRRGVLHGLDDPIVRRWLEDPRTPAFLDRPIDELRTVDWTGARHALPLPATGWLLFRAVPSVDETVDDHPDQRLAFVEALVRRGAAPWWGEQAPADRPSASEVWSNAAESAQPNDAWWSLHPEALAPSPAGRNALHAARTAAGAQRWLSLGVDPATVDRCGNQAFTELVARLVSHPAPLSPASGCGALAHWCVNGWAKGVLPTDGVAHGVALSAWVAGRPDLFRAHASAALPAAIEPIGRLHRACIALKPTLVEALIQGQESINGLDDQGWTALSRLAQVQTKTSTQDKAFRTILKALKRAGATTEVAGQAIHPGCAWVQSALKNAEGWSRQHPLPQRFPDLFEGSFWSDERLETVAAINGFLISSSAGAALLASMPPARAAQQMEGLLTVSTWLVGEPPAGSTRRSSPYWSLGNGSRVAPVWEALWERAGSLGDALWFNRDRLRAAAEQDQAAWVDHDRGPSEGWAEELFDPLDLCASLQARGQQAQLRGGVPCVGPSKSGPNLRL